MATKERESNERIARENEEARVKFESALAMLSSGVTPLNLEVVPTKVRFDSIDSNDQKLVQSAMDTRGCTSLNESDSYVSLLENLEEEFTFAPCQLVFVDTDGTQHTVLDEKNSFTDGIQYLGIEDSKAKVHWFLTGPATEEAHLGHLTFHDFSVNEYTFDYQVEKAPVAEVAEPVSDI